MTEQHSNKQENVETILGTEMFLNANADHKLEILTQPAEGKERSVFLSQIAQSPAHMEELLNSEVLVNLGAEFCANLLNIRDKYGKGILDFALKKGSPDYLAVLLNSKVLEILHKNDLYLFLAERQKDFHASSLGKAIEKSPEHMHVYLSSKAIKNLNGDQLHQLLSLNSNEEQQLNSLWHVLFKGKEYWKDFLNHPSLDKLNSDQTSVLLLSKYELDNSDIPLTYMVTHNSIEDLRDLLESKVFIKLDPPAKYLQYNTRNDNKLSALDISVTRTPEFLKELLECSSCFQFTEEKNLEMLISKDSQELLALVYKAFYSSPDFIKVLLNSNKVVDMSQLNKFQLMNEAMQTTGFTDDARIPDPAIMHDVLKLHAIIESRVFQSLDCKYQVALLGEEGLHLYETMVQPNSSTAYTFHCD